MLQRPEDTRPRPHGQGCYSCTPRPRVPRPMPITGWSGNFSTTCNYSYCMPPGFIFWACERL